jgi:hypothetical protein
MANNKFDKIIEQNGRLTPFEIDIDLCLKNRRPFKITNESKLLRRCVMASNLDELQWLSKYKLNLNPQAKVSIFLEKDGTEVDDQKFFEKLSEQTRFVAKEVRLITDDDIKQFSMKHTTGFKNVKVGRYSERKNIGLKIAGT